MGWTELPVIVDAFAALVLLLGAVALTLWLDVALVTWAIDARRRERWGWFTALALVTPCWLLSTGAWLVSTSWWIVANFGDFWGRQP